jgi:hypothetical protein
LETHTAWGMLVPMGDPNSMGDGTMNDYVTTTNINTITDLNIAVGDLNYSATRTIIVENSPEFLNSRKVRVKINLFSSPNVLDPTISKTLVFRSAGTFYLSF